MQNLLIGKISIEKGDFMKLVVTVTGVDRIGIIAGVSRILDEKKVNILSVNQNILDGFFNMILMGELDETQSNLETVQAELAKEAEKLGVNILVQHADIFYSMHRI